MKLATKDTYYNVETIDDFINTVKGIRASADYDNTGRGFSIKVTMHHEFKGKITKTIREWIEYLSDDKNYEKLW